MPDANHKQLIESIRAELESGKGTLIARHYQNALTLISQVVFTRTSGFLLEFIQNAEDAGLGLDCRGVFTISLNKQRVIIVHNARPFGEADVRSVCGIQSSKRPERGTLGYLGIGFKSVFKVTNCPHIFSNGFQFKFDKSHWSNSSDSLWRVMPLWVEEKPEGIDPSKTTFIIPFRDARFYEHLRQDLEKLGTELYLFLRWLRKIEIHDEETGEAWSLENLGEDGEGVTTLKHNGSRQRFKFFRKRVTVPSGVQQDELTQEFRSRVKEREIAIAFALDEENNLSPSEAGAGAMYGGVYSFLPLGETTSGAKFPIQADFLVQPGRDAINCEAAWNHWLVEEIAKLCRDAIEQFKNNEPWKFQFLPVFNNEWSAGEAYQQLFNPKLFEPIKAYLETTACIPTRDGSWAKPEETVRLDEEQKAVEGLTSLGFFADDEIGQAFADSDVCLAHPDVKDGIISIRAVNRLNLLRNSSYLSQKAGSNHASDWFRKLYLWLKAHPTNQTYIQRGKRYPSEVRYHDFAIVLTARQEVMQGGKVLLVDLPAAEPTISDLATEHAISSPVLHPDVLAKASTDIEREELRGFLTGYTGVQILDAKKVCEDVILPKLLVNAQQPSQADLVKYTRYCKQILGTSIPDDHEFWIATKDGHIRPARETLLASEFNPESNWEPNQQFVGGLNFVSTDYLDDGDTSQLQEWRQFFKRGGVKEKPEGGVEEFAINFVYEYLNSTYAKVESVERRKVGYDMEAEAHDGKVMRIEVKGLSADGPVELSGNEPDAAHRHKDSFYLFVVSGIPENPAMYMVRNPAAEGKMDILTIPVSVWKAGRITTTSSP